MQQQGSSQLDLSNVISVVGKEAEKLFVKLNVQMD